jgi:hypothetical protein
MLVSGADCNLPPGFHNVYAFAHRMQGKINETRIQEVCAALYCFSRRRRGSVCRSIGDWN